MFFPARGTAGVGGAFSRVREDSTLRLRAGLLSKCFVKASLHAGSMDNAAEGRRSLEAAPVAASPSERGDVCEPAKEARTQAGGSQSAAPRPREASVSPAVQSAACAERDSAGGAADAMSSSSKGVSLSASRGRRRPREGQEYPKRPLNSVIRRRLSGEPLREETSSGSRTAQTVFPEKRFEDNSRGALLRRLPSEEVATKAFSSGTPESQQPFSLEEGEIPPSPEDLAGKVAARGSVAKPPETRVVGTALPGQMAESGKRKERAPLVQFPSPPSKVAPQNAVPEQSPPSLRSPRFLGEGLQPHQHQPHQDQPHQHQRHQPRAAEEDEASEFFSPRGSSLDGAESALEGFSQRRFSSRALASNYEDSGLFRDSAAALFEGEAPPEDALSAPMEKDPACSFPSNAKDTAAASPPSSFPPFSLSVLDEPSFDPAENSAEAEAGKGVSAFSATATHAVQQATSSETAAPVSSFVEENGNGVQTASHCAAPTNLPSEAPFLSSEADDEALPWSSLEEQGLLRREDGLLAERPWVESLRGQVSVLLGHKASSDARANRLDDALLLVLKVDRSEADCLALGGEEAGGCFSREWMDAFRSCQHVLVQCSGNFAKYLNVLLHEGVSGCVARKSAERQSEELALQRAASDVQVALI